MNLRCGVQLLGTLMACLGLVKAAPAKACASCGSGASSPLSLYPNEGHKVYLSLGLTGQFKTIDAFSKIGSDGGPARRETVTLALGTRISDRSFFTLTLPVVRNLKGDRSFTSLSDSILQFNYTLVSSSLAEPMLPQVQILASHSYPFGLSIRDTDDGFDPLKITSSGTQESEFGMDIWFGSSLIKWGTALTVLLPEERTFARSLTFEPGLGNRSVFTLGVAKEQVGKIITGITRLQRDRIRVNGSPIADSEILNHSAFLTAEYMFADQQSLRLSYLKTGIFTDALSNRNGSISDSVTMSWIMASPFR